MRVVKWVALLLVAVVVGGFLHYVLPRHAVVYVTSTENRIVSPDEVRGFRSFSEGNATNAQGQVVTDVFFINTTRRSGGADANTASPVDAGAHACGCWFGAPCCWWPCWLACWAC